MRLHCRFALTLALLLPATAAHAQEPAPAPPPYYYVPAPEDHGASLRGLRPKPVKAMRPGAMMLLFDWSVAAPLGSVADYVGDVSLRGVQIDLRYWVHRAVSLGVGLGWQLFDEKKERATYPIDSGAITATLYRSVEMVPILGTVHVYPGGYGPVKPFFGLGVGPAYTYFQTLAADLGWVKSEWFFAFQPEAGVFIGRDTPYRSFGLNLSVRYTWLPATFGEVTNAQTLGANVGLYSLF